MHRTRLSKVVLTVHPIIIITIIIIIIIIIKIIKTVKTMHMLPDWPFLAYSSHLKLTSHSLFDECDVKKDKTSFYITYQKIKMLFTI